MQSQSNEILSSEDFLDHFVSKLLMPDLIL
jgi:hypothetical protein